jgi:CheY-like chemotaxis protein
MDGERVLVVFEPVRSGAATLELARDLVERQGATLTVVSVAPQGMSCARCGNSARDYNLAVRDSVAGDLAHARARLEEFGVPASYALLLDGVAPSLDEFATAGRFDLVLLPARRRPIGGHPAAERLRRTTGADVQVIAPRHHQRTHG